MELASESDVMPCAAWAFLAGEAGLCGEAKVDGRAAQSKREGIRKMMKR